MVPEKESQNGLKIFLGIMMVLGGILSILIPASSLKMDSLSSIILGITLVMLGDSYVWGAIEAYRKKKREKNKTEDEK